MGWFDKTILGSIVTPYEKKNAITNCQNKTHSLGCMDE